MERVIKIVRTAFTEDTIKKGREFKPKPTDVFVITYPKCGTTWVTYICHLLRSAGKSTEGNFDRLVPFDILSTAAGIDLNADQGFFPRLYKSHENFNNVAKGAKYIVVLRDPLDAFVSYYNMQMKLYQLPDEKISIEEFSEVIHSPRGVFGYIPDFYQAAIAAKNSNQENILWLYYEDLKADRMIGIRRIAQFMGLESLLNEAELEKRCQVAYEMSSLEYMKDNPTEVMPREIRAYMQQFKPKIVTTGLTTVSKGVTGGGKSLPDSVKHTLEELWKGAIEDVYGFKTYQELREKIK